MDLQRIKEVISSPDSSREAVVEAVQTLVSRLGVTEENTGVLLADWKDVGELARDYKEWADNHTLHFMWSFSPSYAFPTGGSGDDYVMVVSEIDIPAGEAEILADFFYNLGGHWDQDGNVQLYEGEDEEPREEVERGRSSEEQALSESTAEIFQGVKERFEAVKSIARTYLLTSDQNTNPMRWVQEIEGQLEAVRKFFDQPRRGKEDAQEGT